MVVTNAMSCMVVYMEASPCALRVSGCTDCNSRTASYTWLQMIFDARFPTSPGVSTLTIATPV